MLAILFGLVVLASLATSIGIFLEIIPASPGVLGLIAVVHIAFTWLFLRAYRGYRALHRLVTDGQGELFSLAIAQLIGSSRFRGFRDHYRLRRCQGLVLTGNALEALNAIDQFKRHARAGQDDRLSVLAAEAEANLQLDQPFWTEQSLDIARQIPGAHKHRGIAALEARLALERGDAEQAAQQLGRLTSVRHFPLTRVLRARNLLWYGEALTRAGQQAQAARAFKKANKTAPRSVYGRQAARRAGRA